MRRRTRTVREMRQEYEAAEARGLVSDEKKPAREPASGPAKPKPTSMSRMKMVWQVCDQGGRPVATFPYPQKPEAEALAEQLKARGKGKHFVRAEKVSMNA